MRHYLSECINAFLFYALRLRRKFKKEAQSGGILLIRFSHIGDFVVWLDAAKEFRRLYPDEKITFLCDRYKDVGVLAKQTGYFDEVIVMETRGAKRLQSICQAMNWHYRAVINADLSRTVLSDLFVLAVGADVRIAPKSDLTRMRIGQRKRSDKIYDVLLECDDIETMELIRNAQLIRGLGKLDFKAAQPYIGKLQDIPVLPFRYFALCPGGEMPQKFWEAGKYAQVIGHIFQRDREIRCVALGVGAEEHEWRKILKILIEGILSGGIDRERCISMLGKTSLTAYVEWIRGAQWLLTNDTSAAHIAAAVGTPAVVIAPSWNRGRFYPYRTERATGRDCFPIAVFSQVPCAGCGKYKIRADRLGCIVHGRVACVDRIAAEDVSRAIDQIMDQLMNVNETEVMGQR